MLKKFLISMLGTVAGLWISALIAVVVIVCLISSAVASHMPEVKLTDKSILYIKLDGDIAERHQPGDLLQLLSDADTGGDSFVDMLDAIALAANDGHISGLYIDGGLPELGSGSREELLEAVRAFKKSGKWVVAYGDYYVQPAYQIASAADDVYLNPVGSVDVHGVASMNIFFTGLLDKLGIKMHIVRVGTYKSAVEPFFATEMSPASRLQTQAMVDTLWSVMSADIAANRGLKLSDVTAWADSIISCWPAGRALETGAVTALDYRRKAENVLREKIGIDRDEELPLITAADYLSTRKTADPEKDHLAVLFAVGDIVDTGEGGIAGDVMTPEIIRLADDEHVKGLVLRVNSGGGSAFASEQIWEALEYFKSTGKPFYVSMGDVAASGGYYISCGADRIYADRTTLTGSIGVFGIVPDMKGLLTGHLGLTFSTVESNPNAMPLNIYGDMSEQQLAALQSGVNDIYETFTRRVAEGRGISQDSVKQIAEGRVWVGGKALEIGLVDELAGLRKAVADAASKSGVGVDKVVYYPEIGDDFMMELLREARGSVSYGGMSMDGSALRMMRFVQYLSRMNPIQARMTPVEIK